MERKQKLLPDRIMRQALAQAGRKGGHARQAGMSLAEQRAHMTMMSKLGNAKRWAGHKKKGREKRLD